MQAFCNRWFCGGLYIYIHENFLRKAEVCVYSLFISVAAAVLRVLPFFIGSL